MTRAEFQANPDAHQAVDDAFHVLENDFAIPFPLLANDNYSFANGAQVVSVGATAQGGTVTITNNPGGEVEYQPPADYTGLDSFSYVLQDEVSGATSQGTVTVYVGIDPNQVLSGPGAGLAAEELQVYEIVAQVCSTEPDTDFPCEDINQLSDEEQRELIQQISGRHVRLQSRTLRQMRNQQSGNIRSRLAEIRSGSNRLSVNGLNAAIFGKSVPVASAFQHELNSALQGGSAGDGDLTTPWGFFLNGNLTLGEAKSRNSRPRYDQDGYNLTMGLDYRLSDTLIAGFAAGYSKSDMDFGRDFGQQDSNSYSLSLFGNYYPRENVYIDGLIMLVNGGLDVERSISVGPISQQLASDTDSQQIVLSTSAGYEFNYERWQASLYGRLEYSDLTVDAYRETGSSFALAVSEQETNSFDGAIGTRLGYVFNFSRGVIVPNIELEYLTRQEDDYTIESRFLNAPLAPQFSLNAEEEDTQHLNLSTSISAVFSAGRSGFFRYETMLLQDNYDVSSYSLGFRMEF